MRSQEGLVSCDTFVIVGKEGVGETNLKDLNVSVGYYTVVS